MDGEMIFVRRVASAAIAPKAIARVGRELRNVHYQAVP